MDAVNIIGDVLFFLAVFGIIGYQLLKGEKQASLSQLGDVQRWHKRQYITKEELEAALSADGSMSLKEYEKLKSKVSRLRTLKTLTQ